MYASGAFLDPERLRIIGRADIKASDANIRNNSQKRDLPITEALRATRPPWNGFVATAIGQLSPGETAGGRPSRRPESGEIYGKTDRTDSLTD